jgi:hypothetical protein
VRQLGRLGVGLALLLSAVLVVPAAAQASCSTAGSSYAQAVSGTTGVVSFWRLSEASGSVACDTQGVSSGAYQPGTSLGQPGPLVGDPATATGFDGSSGWASVPDVSALHLGDTFSVEGWVKRGRSGTGQNEVIASKQDGSWVLMFNGSDQLTLRRSTVADVASSTTTITDTTRWHYVVATKSGSAVHLYVDGADVTGPVSNQTMVDNTQPLAIGQSTGGAYLKGSIADVAVYKTALTPQQVTGHYNLGTGNTGGGGGGGGGGSTDPSIVAAGDIACSPSDPDFNGGNGDAAGCMELSTSNLMAGNYIGGNPIAAVLPLGDEQYDNATLSEFNGSYGPSWGRVNALSHPVPGNHEYYTSGASGYYDYFDGVGRSTGPAGDRTKGYYSYNVGTWHLIALNSNCAAIGGCGAGSPEERWLLSDLSANASAVCTLAYWHHPLFHSGTETGGDAMKQLFTDLYNANADVVLNGHEHQYERFAPQKPTAASQPNGGIREFIVGTGGKSLESFGTTAANSEVRNSTTYGVLRLILHPTSYDWQFIPSAGGSFTDSGTTSCHTSH